jgi:O-antigen ligase
VTSLLAPPAPAAEPGTPHRSRPAQRLPDLAAVALLAWWAGPMTSREGGRGAGATAIALVLVTVMLLLTAPWRVLPARVLALVVAVPAAALLVCLTAPTGWYGADDLAAYTVAALAVPAFAAYARTPERRRLVLVAVCLAGLVEFAQAAQSWIAGGDPSQAMVGTFYWWNPYAAYLLPGALLGMALVVRGERFGQLAGWVATPCCVAGIAYSSSRTTLALLVLGMAGMLLLCLDRQRWRGNLLRWALVALLAGGVTVGVSGPPFFEHRAGVTAAVDAKADRGETVSQNSAYRLEFWKRSLAVAKDRPLVGSGPHGLLGASDPLVPADYARSNLVHNGYLQALSDGGLVLGLPFLLACAGLLAAAARRLVGARRVAEDRWLRIAVPIAFGASMAHSGADFDWSHPSDLLLSALLGGLVLGLPLHAEPTSRRTRKAALFLVPAVALAGVALVASWHWDDTTLDIGQTQGTAAERAHEIRQTGSQPLRDYRWGLGVLRLATGLSGPVEDHGVADDDLRWAVDRTSRVAPVDTDTQMMRSRGLVLLGKRDEAVQIVTDLLTRLGPARSVPIADQAAQTLQAAGRHAQARQLLVRSLALDPTAARAPAHVAALLQIDTGALDDVDRCAYASLDPTTLASSEAPGAVPDPGAPPAGTSCASVLQGAAA